MSIIRMIKKSYDFGVSLISSSKFNINSGFSINISDSSVSCASTVNCALIIDSQLKELFV